MDCATATPGPGPGPERCAWAVPVFKLEVEAFGPVLKIGKKNSREELREMSFDRVRDGCLRVRHSLPGTSRAACASTDGSRARAGQASTEGGFGPGASSSRSSQSPGPRGPPEGRKEQYCPTAHALGGRRSSVACRAPRDRAPSAPTSDRPDSSEERRWASRRTRNGSSSECAEFQSLGVPASRACNTALQHSSAAAAT